MKKLSPLSHKVTEETWFKGRDGRGKGENPSNFFEGKREGKRRAAKLGKKGGR